MAVHLSKSNFDSWGVAATMPLLTQAPAKGKKKDSWSNESIMALYTLRREGTGFKNRVFWPRAPKGN